MYRSYIVLLFLLASCTHDSNIDHIVFCDAEKVIIYNGVKYFVSNGPSMKQGDLQSKERAFSKTHSMKLASGVGMHFRPAFFEKGDYYELSVWCYGDISQTDLILSTGDHIYKGIQVVDEKKGWQKIRQKGQISPKDSITDLQIMIINDLDQAVYFDDFSIKELKNIK